jgi:predicted enzyme related to lactoylglutathione lyase
MANLVVHFEIHASDPQRLIDFYGQLFGWKFTQFGDQPYWSIDTGEGAAGPDTPGRGINGGLTQRPGAAPEPGAPVNGCDIVVAVEGSIDDVFQRGLDLGGTEALPLSDMEGVGRVGYLLDPDGNVFGLISPVLSDGRDMMGS